MKYKQKENCILRLAGMHEIKIFFGKSTTIDTNWVLLMS